jgi:hypothetical protein
MRRNRHTQQALLEAPSSADVRPAVRQPVAPIRASVEQPGRYAYDTEVLEFVLRFLPVNEPPLLRDQAVRERAASGRGRVPALERRISSRCR